MYSSFGDRNLGQYIAPSTRESTKADFSFKSWDGEPENLGGTKGNGEKSSGGMHKTVVSKVNVSMHTLDAAIQTARKCDRRREALQLCFQSHFCARRSPARPWLAAAQTGSTRERKLSPVEEGLGRVQGERMDVSEMSLKPGLLQTAHLKCCANPIRHRLARG